MAFVTKVRPYTQITLDLTNPRANAAQGTVAILGNAVDAWKANTITFLSLGGGTLSFRLNNSAAGLITASDGLRVEGEVFSEIYWTHSAQVGKAAEIHIAWVD